MSAWANLSGQFSQPSYTGPRQLSKPQEPPSVVQGRIERFQHHVVDFQRTARNVLRDVYVPPEEV